MSRHNARQAKQGIDTRQGTKRYITRPRRVKTQATKRKGKATGKARLAITIYRVKVSGIALPLYRVKVRGWMRDDPEKLVSALSAFCVFCKKFLLFCKKVLDIGKPMCYI